MRRCVVVSNAGPLIHLAKISLLGLLKSLYGEVVIPIGVRLEALDRGMERCFPDTIRIKRALEGGPWRYQAREGTETIWEKFKLRALPLSASLEFNPRRASLPHPSIQRREGSASLETNLAPRFTGVIPMEPSSSSTPPSIAGETSETSQPLPPQPLSKADGGHSRAPEISHHIAYYADPHPPYPPNPQDNSSEYDIVKHFEQL